MVAVVESSEVLRIKRFEECGVYRYQDLTHDRVVGTVYQRGCEWFISSPYCRHIGASAGVGLTGGVMWTGFDSRLEAESVLSEEYLEWVNNQAVPAPF